MRDCVWPCFSIPVRLCAACEWLSAVQERALSHSMCVPAAVLDLRAPGRSSAARVRPHWTWRLCLDSGLCVSSERRNRPAADGHRRVAEMASVKLAQQCGRTMHNVALRDPRDSRPLDSLRPSLSPKDNGPPISLAVLSFCGPHCSFASKQIELMSSCGLGVEFVCAPASSLGRHCVARTQWHPRRHGAMGPRRLDSSWPPGADMAPAEWASLGLAWD